MEENVSVKAKRGEGRAFSLARMEYVSLPLRMLVLCVMYVVRAITCSFDAVRGRATMAFFMARM